MKRLACLCAIVVMSLTSCTKKQPLPEPVCKLMFKATTSAAAVIATTLQCENMGAIAADLSEPLMKLELCSDTAAQASLSDLVCPQIATLLTSVATDAIPANWQCSATAVSEIVKMQIIGGCVKMVK